MVTHSCFVAGFCMYTMMMMMMMKIIFKGPLFSMIVYQSKDERKCGSRRLEEFKFRVLHIVTEVGAG